MPIHAKDKFEAGIHFHVDVVVKYLEDELVSGSDIVTLDINCLSASRHVNHLINNNFLVHGTAFFDLNIPENIKEIKINAKYLHNT